MRAAACRPALTPSIPYRLCVGVSTRITSTGRAGAATATRAARGTSRGSPSERAMLFALAHRDEPDLDRPRRRVDGEVHAAVAADQHQPAALGGLDRLEQVVLATR